MLIAVSPYPALVAESCLGDRQLKSRAVASPEPLSISFLDLEYQKSVIAGYAP
jgi:hypothetical protein